MLESKVEGRLVEGVEALDGLCLKFTSPGRRGPPDRLILLHFLEPHMVETKRPGKVAEQHQRREHTRYRERRMPVYILDTTEKVDFHLAMLADIRLNMKRLGVFR